MNERLAEVAPELHRLLQSRAPISYRFSAAEIRRETVRVTMRDGVRLATDLYLPPVLPAPAVAMRTPYGRAARFAEVFETLARNGYVVISQDCRGTGDSEPESWDYYVYEREDSFDFVEWVIRQPWFDGFLGSCGGSYVAQTQWCMALHPRMSCVAPLVGGLGIASRTVRKHLFYHAYARSIGKGTDKVPVAYDELERQMLPETLATGYYDEPLSKPFSEALRDQFPQLRTLPAADARQWLWQHYCSLPPTGRAELIRQAVGGGNITIVSIEALPAVFGQHIAHDAHMFAAANPVELCRAIHAPALMITGWYDWSLNDPPATWQLLRREARESVRSRSRFVITPAAHGFPGYHEGSEQHPELKRSFNLGDVTDLLMRWYAAVREGTTDAWPDVIYYLMGANEWRVARDWPPPDAKPFALYAGPGGTLAARPPEGDTSPDRYTYDPQNPTPTLGGSIVSFVSRPGSVDVSEVQERVDVLTYSTPVLEQALDVVGPLKLVLYASSSAIDTDFSARLSDVFPDGRAIQLQSGIVRTRFRDLESDPAPLEPGRIYCFEIDMWITANRFYAGHRLRLDISSADFPRFDRNTNRGGEPGPPVMAQQAIYHDADHPTHLVLSVLGGGEC